MDYQQLKIITELRFKDKLDEFVEKPIVVESWGHEDKKRQRLYISMLARPDDMQTVIDRVEAICGRTSDTHILVTPISAILSVGLKKESEKVAEKTLPKSTAITREQLYNIVASGAKLDLNFILLVVLSTVVAAIGLLENRVTVIIGAMVIAPLLGPNLAMALGATLGDWRLMKQSIRANFAGIIICITLSFLIGLLWPYGTHSAQIILRTDLSYAVVVLALASGAAAALSITSGLSTILVGVMVSAALLPPLCVLGLLLGNGSYYGAVSAGLVVMVNIIAINLVANLTFVFQGILPSRWYERQKARKAIRKSLLFWSILLIIMAALIYLRHGGALT